MRLSICLPIKYSSQLWNTHYVVRRTQICQSARGTWVVCLFVRLPLIGSSSYLAFTSSSLLRLCSAAIFWWWYSDTFAGLVFLLTRYSLHMASMCAVHCTAVLQVGRDAMHNQQIVRFLPVVHSDSHQQRYFCKFSCIGLFWDIWEGFSKSFQEQMRIASSSGFQQIKHA